jgi:hypothetical protein
MIFGLFNTKGQRLLKMTEESLTEANAFPNIIKEKIGEEIILWMKRCENEDINSLKDIGKEAMEERQSEITAMGEKNPNWVRACIVESYITAKILGKAKGTKAITKIFFWLQDNAPKVYKKNFKDINIASFLK